MDVTDAPARPVGPALIAFTQALFGRVPAEDLAPYPASALAELAAQAFRHLCALRRGHGPDIRLNDIEVEREGRRRELTILEVVNDNMPFLLDSTLAEVVAQGYEPTLVAHPILAVERAPDGALARLVGEATTAAADGPKRESFIHVHLPRIDDAAARTRLLEALTAVYADVAVAVADWKAMRERVLGIVAAYRSAPPPLPE